MHQASMAFPFDGGMSVRDALLTTCYAANTILI